MRYGVISDVHSNLEALEAVLEELSRERVDALLCAGDSVGYAADPVACLSLLRASLTRAVYGNHEHAVLGKMDLGWFNDAARASVEWTSAQLTSVERGYLEGLPLIWRDSHVTLAHGSIHEPEQFHYVLELGDAEASLNLQKTPAAFIGHTHAPVIFLKKGPQVSFSRANELAVEPECRVLVNVGSVGQPRDGDPRAAYCLYDTETRVIQIRRAAYPFQKTQEKIRRAGLPIFFAERLAYGR